MSEAPDDTQQVSPPVAAADPAKSFAAARSMAEVRARLFGEEPRPDKLGSYEIEDVLGWGGIGVVYAGFDPRLRRRVAIKLIRDRDGRKGDEPHRAEQEQRLLREAQALAHLRHPNIVTVHDVGFFDQEDLGTRLGTHDRGLFVVMELIEGETLSEWCASADRSWQETVHTLLAAGRGLAAAHGAGVLHRDFKPSNVIVGSDARVQVLDFGLARLDGPVEDSPDSNTALSDTSSDPLTECGTIMGTPAYMAPEQHDGTAADERSDVYAYSITLWELLVGARPFRGSLETLVRRKKLGPPPFPAGPALPAWLRRAIVRGLEPDPERRWPSMESLLEAIEHGLQRRRRRMMAGLASPVVLLAIVGGAREYARYRSNASCDVSPDALFGVWDPSRREAAKRALLDTRLAYAAATWETTEQTLDGYADAWVAVRRQVCLDGDMKENNAPLLCLERRRAELGAVVDLLADADAGIARSAVATTQALAPIEPCRHEMSTSVGGSSELSRTFARTIGRAHVLRVAGRDADAKALIEPLLAQIEATGDPGLLAEARIEYGRSLYTLGERDAAEAALRAALYAAETAGNDRTRLEALRPLVSLLMGYGTRYAEAQALLDQAEAVYTRTHAQLPGPPPWLFELRGLLATYQGDYPRARDAFARQLEAAEELAPPRPLQVAAALLNVGKNQVDLGNPEQAVELEARALEIRSSALGADHPSNAAVLSSLGVAAGRRGDTRNELHYYQRALVLLEADGTRKSKLAMVLGNMAGTLERVGDHEQARANMKRAIALAEEVYGPAHPNVARYLTTRAALNLNEYPSQAEADCERAVEIWARSNPDNPDGATCWHNLGMVSVGAERFDEALERYGRGLDLVSRSGARKTHYAAPLLLSGLANVRVQQRDYERALPLLEEALETSRAQGLVKGELLIEIHANFALVLDKTDPERARHHRDRADELRRRSERVRTE